MTFGLTLGEHLTMAALASVFCMAIDYENKLNMKVAASNINIKIHQLFPEQRTFGVLVTTAENLRGLTRTYS